MLPQWAALLPNTLFAKINIDKGQFASMSSLAPTIPTFFTMDGTQVLNKFVGSEKVPMMMQHLKSIDDKKSLMMRLQADIKEREKKVRQAPRAAPKTAARKASKPVSRKAVAMEAAPKKKPAKKAKMGGRIESTRVDNRPMDVAGEQSNRVLKQPKGPKRPPVRRQPRLREAAHIMLMPRRQNARHVPLQRLDPRWSEQTFNQFNQRR